MPRIKSPISPQERNYNERYEVKVQQSFLKRIDERKLDRYALDFVQSCKFCDAAGNLILSEAQADFLASLYDKYST